MLFNSETFQISFETNAKPLLQENKKNEKYTVKKAMKYIEYSTKFKERRRQIGHINEAVL